MVQAAGGELPFAMASRSPPVAKQQLEAFFADLERELEKVEFFRPEEKRGTMSSQPAQYFSAHGAAQQDIRTLHGVITAIAQGRKGPARGGVARRRQAEKLRESSHARRFHGAGRAPARAAARLLRRNPTEAERTLWQALVNDRRFAGLRFKRQVPIGPHITDFVSFPLAPSSIW